MLQDNYWRRSISFADKQERTNGEGSIFLMIIKFCEWNQKPPGYWNYLLKWFQYLLVYLLCKRYPWNITLRHLTQAVKVNCRKMYFPKIFSLAACKLTAFSTIFLPNVVDDTTKSVPLTPLSQTSWCVIDTAESKSTVSLAPLRQTSWCVIDTAESNSSVFFTIVETNYTVAWTPDMYINNVFNIAESNSTEALTLHS
jgi:hypothetical protein